MDNLHYRLILDLGKPDKINEIPGKNLSKVVNSKIWSQNAVKYGKYRPAKFAIIFEPKMVEISARNTVI